MVTNSVRLHGDNLIRDAPDEVPLMISMNSVLPGCDWKIASPYHRPIEAGIRAEQERLRGKRWLVAVHIETFDYDLLWPDTVFLDEGFDVLDRAIVRANVLQQEILETSRQDRPSWQAGTCIALWPERQAIKSQPIFRKVSHWLMNEQWPRQTFGRLDYRRQIDVAVLAINPESPIDFDLIQTIGFDSEMQSYFANIASPEDRDLRNSSRKNP